MNYFAVSLLKWVNYNRLALKTKYIIFTPICYSIKTHIQPKKAAHTLPSALKI